MTSWIKEKSEHKNRLNNMKKFQQENDELDQTMKTHLIPDLEKFGIWDDDYDTFFKERAELVSKEIKKRLLDK